MEPHPYGWLSLLPPLVAIVLALLTRKAAISLLTGVLVGATILAGGNPIVGLKDTVVLYLWQAIADVDRLQVFAFTLVMGSMVGVISASGGMRSLVDKLTPWANNRRRGQLLTWALGLIVFFDDYANSLLLGTTLRGLCDRLRISREKLAYIVDSTSAPVAGLALISTWVAGEIDYINSGLEKLNADVPFSGLTIFVMSVPYRFYVLWALMLVPLAAWFARELGPMYQAEQACLDEPTPAANSPSAESDQPPLAHWLSAVVPVVATVLAILGLLFLTGIRRVTAEAEIVDPTILDILNSAKTNFSLFWGSLVGLVLAVGFALSGRALQWAALVKAMTHGASLMVAALVILWFAGALSDMTKNGGDDADSFAFQRHHLYTGEYISNLVGENAPLWAVPTVVFLLSSAVAFSTGTSWGTMAIVMPLAIPLAGSSVGGPGEVGVMSPLLLATTGSVLAGSIFGDHCSPISDTTVLSSQASGCNHIAHVRTQLPYALLVGVVSVVFGTLPVGLGVPVWVMLPIGTCAIAGLLLLLGRKAERSGS